ncbi:unnamed protein product [Closterium sp. NIES-53]
MALRPSSVPHHVDLPSPPASSLLDVPDPESELARASSPTVTHLLAVVVTDPSFESTAVFAQVTELVDFATTRRLDYVASLFELEFLVAALPRFVSMLLRPEGDPDALDILTPHSYAETISVEYSSQWQTAMDAEMASWKSTGTYAPCEWHDALKRTLAALGFAPSTADPSLLLHTDPTLVPFYILVYVLLRFSFQYSSPQRTPLPTGHSL